MELKLRDDCWVGTFQAMASPCEVHLRSTNRSLAQETFERVVAETRRIEAKYSRYRTDSVLSEINAGSGQPMAVDEETARLLSFAATVHDLSDGGFDISSGILRKLWTFDGSDNIPAKGAVSKLLCNVGWDRIRWEPPVLLMPAGMELDFGGIGKEYAVDRAIAIASAAIPECMINFGGDLAATTTAINTRGWAVGIENPRAGHAQKQVRLTRGGIATSGDARRFLIRDGVRYSHILDARTGWPVPEAPRSVTVAAPTCTHAGMLATLAMLQGNKAEDFLNRERFRHWIIR